MLPGWSGGDAALLGADTPVSQLSQAGGGLPAPVPDVVGLPSPHKARGSFMNRCVR